MVEFQEATGHLYNLEATPAEGTTYRFAKEDRRRYPRILQAGTDDHPYYTNSSQLPVGFTDDPFEALDRQDELQTKYTGGTVLHLYMSERISTPEACRKLVQRRARDAPRCRTSPSRRRSRSARRTGTCRASVLACPTCGGVRPRYGRASWATTGRSSSFNVGKQGEHAERLALQ